jgi:hypothetical protein
MRILISAYACEPGKGSEQEVGLQVMLAAAQRHDIWVLTRENSISLLEDYLAQHPLRDRIRLQGIVVLISPSDPESTASRLAAAVDEFLNEPPEPPPQLVPPVASFDSSLLDVYDQAVELARALP